MGKMPTDSLCKSSELKLHCFCLFDAYSMPKDMCSMAKKLENICKKANTIRKSKFVDG